MSDLIEMGSEYEDGDGEAWVILAINGLTESYPVIAQRKSDCTLGEYTNSGVFDIRCGNSEFDLKKVEQQLYVVIFEHITKFVNDPNYWVARFTGTNGYGKWIATVKYKVGQDDSENNNETS